MNRPANLSASLPGGLSADPPRLSAAALAGLPGLRHGFFGRRGGVSTGLYASLNCGLGSADEMATVKENRARVAKALGVAADRLLTPYQVHGRDVVTLAASRPASARPRADALVTDRPGIALGVLSADCAPVLLCDPAAGIIGAAHAGWRGALAGVTDAVVDAMAALGAAPDGIRAAIGPCISAVCYEVGPEVHAAFVDVAAETNAFFTASAADGRRRFDLTGYVAERLRARGVGQVEVLRRCTYTEETEFFSFRRATHRGEADYGRAVAAIALADEADELPA